MTLLYHRRYDDDVTVANVDSLCFRNVRMTWSYADSPLNETTLIFLLSSSPFTSHAGSTLGEKENELHVLKVVHLKGTVTEPNGSATTSEEVVYDAVFEISSPVADSVIKGTGGVIFLSTRHFFFQVSGSAVNGPSDGGRYEGTMDRFLFTDNLRWERQCGAIRPLLDVEPIRRVFDETASSDNAPKLHLVAHISPPSPTDTSSPRSSVNILIVASARDKDDGHRDTDAKGGASRGLSGWFRNSSSTTPAPRKRATTQTILLAVLRCEITHVLDDTAQWELLHLFVDRSVPFHQRIEEIVGREDSRGAQIERGDDASAAHIDPSRCVWCYLPHHAQAAGGICGVVVALVPQRSSESISITCGGYDAQNQTYRLGLTKDSGKPQQHAVDFPDERGQSEESLWNLSENTQTVQMVLLGKTVEALNNVKDQESTTAQGRVGSRSHWKKNTSSTSWLRQSGLATVLTFVVDFLDDKLPGSEHRHQGLYVTACSAWECNRHGRFPLPPLICWIGITPLPIGQATDNAVLFANRSSDDGPDALSMVGKLTHSSDVLNGEDTSSWYHSLPTSIASALPKQVGLTALYCFVSINTLLNKTQLTYVRGINSGAASPYEKEGAASHLRKLLTKLFYTKPITACGENEAGDYSASMAAYMARTVSLSVDGFVAADFLGEAWHVVARVTYPEASKYVRDCVAKCGTLPSSSSETTKIGSAVLRFMILFLLELDWITPTEGESFRAVVLRLLEALYSREEPLHSFYRMEVFTGNRTTETPPSRGCEGKTIKLLLEGCDAWQFVAPTLFAWANRRCGTGEVQEPHKEFTLEDLLQPLLEHWKMGEDPNEFPSTTGDTTIISISRNIHFGDIGCSPALKTFVDAVQRVRVCQDADKYKDAVTSLFRSGVSLHKAATLVIWKHDVQCVDPLIFFVQLLLEVSVRCDDATRTSSSIGWEVVSQLSASVVKLYVSSLSESNADGTTQTGATHISAMLLELLSTWDFGSLKDWPFGGVCGALPAVYFLSHLTAAVTAPTDRESEGVAVHPLMHSVSLLEWLCGGDAIHSVEVLNALIAGSVPLSALCVAEGLCENSPHPTFTVKPPLGYSGEGYHSFNRALHHLLASSSSSILERILMAAVETSSDYLSGGGLGLKLWACVVDGDVAAAYNPRLLSKLRASFRLLESNTEHCQARLASILLEFIRPLFVSALPRLLAVVFEPVETVRDVLAANVHPSSASVLPEPPLDVSECIVPVFISMMSEVRELLSVFKDYSDEVRCLASLFGVFRLAFDFVRTPSSPVGVSACGELQGTVEERKKLFAFNPVEMYLISVQIASDDLGRFVVIAEVMRRCLRQHVAGELNCALQEFDETWLHDGARCRSYLNDLADGIDMVISALDEVTSLYAHTVLMLFLEEFALLTEKTMEAIKSALLVPPVEDEQKGQHEKSEVIVSILVELIKHVTHVAREKWSELNERERKLIAHVLSNYRLFVDDEKALHGGYEESDVHRQSSDLIAHLTESLSRRDIDPAVMSVINGKCSIAERRLSAAEMPQYNAPECVSSGEFGSERDGVVLLVKEEVYMRRKLREQLLNGYRDFTASSEFHEALGTLYLALREEQRRRRFCEYVIRGKELAFHFAISFHTTLRDTCRCGINLLQREAFEEMRKRLQFLFLQERESRGAIEAVYSVQRDIYISLWNDQQLLLREEEGLRIAVVEEEELLRDAIYEGFAKEEVLALRRCEERLEEEAWQEEEKQWALEVRRREEDNTDAACSEESEKNKQSCGKSFLRWQEERLAAAVIPSGREAVSPLSDCRCAAAPMEVEAEAAPGLASSGTLTEPALALESLLQRGPQESHDSGSLKPLLETTESLFGAFSRLQKHIVSTVAPLPSSVSAERVLFENGGDVGTPAVTGCDPRVCIARPQPSQARSQDAAEWEWEDDGANDIEPAVRFRENDTGLTATLDISSVQVPDTAEVRNDSGSSGILKLRALRKAPRPRAQRRRPFGGAVNVDVTISNDSSGVPTPKPPQEVKEAYEAMKFVDAPLMDDVNRVGTMIDAVELGSGEVYAVPAQDSNGFLSNTAALPGCLESRAGDGWEDDSTTDMTHCSTVNIETHRISHDPNIISPLLREEEGARVMLSGEERIARAFLVRRLVMEL